MAGGFWLIMLFCLLGFLFGIILNHFLPLFLKQGLVPQGSFGWPILGETLHFLKPHPSNSIGTFLQEHCSRYGKVFTSHLFFSPTVVSCDQELNYFILQNEDKLFQCSYPKPIHGILGKLSMLVAANDTHKKLRNVALSLVNTTKSKPEFLNDVESMAIQILNSWKNKEQVIFCDEARKFAFNVIVKQVLGLTPDEPRTTQILQDFLTFMRGLISFPLYIPGTPYARAVQVLRIPQNSSLYSIEETAKETFFARSRISSTVKAIIEERRRNIGAENSNSERSDFLEILLCVDNLSEDEKVSFVLDSLLGGYETTFLLMAMVVYFLGQSNVALEQLKLEHQDIRKLKDKDKYLNWEDYRKMVFTQHVINEALRCGNIVKFVHRKALKDVKFRDYVIPSGWKVLPIFSAVHLDPAFHANAFQFNPWRWLDEDQTCKKFTPFGGGSRCCPGSELGKVEVAFFLHHLIQNYRWSIEDGEEPVAYPYVEFRRGLTLNISDCSR